MNNGQGIIRNTLNAIGIQSEIYQLSFTKIARTFLFWIFLFCAIDSQVIIVAKVFNQMLGEGFKTSVAGGYTYGSYNGYFFISGGLHFIIW